MSLFTERSNKSIFNFRNYISFFKKIIDREIMYTYFMYGKFNIEKEEN